MRAEVLETGKYPQIEFASESVSVNTSGEGQFSVALKGNVTLHGVTQPLTITAKVSATGDMLNAFGEFTLRQSDYGTKPVSAVGGGLKVKDELTVSFHIGARRQPD